MRGLDAPPSPRIGALGHPSGDIGHVGAWKSAGESRRAGPRRGTIASDRRRPVPDARHVRAGCSGSRRRPRLGRRSRAPHVPTRTRLPSSSSSPTWPASSASRGMLFVEQERRAEDPTLRAIFRTFVRDEVRHGPGRADAGRLLRRPPLPPLPAEPRPAALHARGSSTPSRYLSDDVANAYITVGELILDIALLRSINDHVHHDGDERPGDAPRRPRRNAAHRNRLVTWSSPLRVARLHREARVRDPKQPIEGAHARRPARSRRCSPSGGALLSRGLLRADGARRPHRASPARGLPAACR